MPAINADQLSEQYQGSFVASPHLPSILAVSKALLAPSSVVSRVSEQHSLLQSRTDVVISRTVQDPELTLVPVLRTAKGELVGNLKVEVDGVRSRTLPFDETKGLLLLLLEALYLKVVGAPDSLLKDLKTMVLARIEPDAGDVRAKVGELNQRIQESSANTTDKESLRVFALASMICDFVLVVVEDGCARTRRVSLEYQAGFAMNGNALARFFRRTFGLSESRYAFDVHAAAESRAYHLNVVGRPGTYVDDSFVRLYYPSASDRAALKIGTTSSRDELLEVGRREGDEVAHLYLRDFDGSPHVRLLGSEPREVQVLPRFIVEFEEVPPGLMGPILGVSLWLFGLTWFVGVFHDTVFTATPGSPASSWPALIFGLPALVTGWLLSKANTELLRITSLPTFFCLIWLTVNAALVVSIAALKSTGIPTPTFTFWVFHVNHLAWATMMLLTALNCGVCLFHFFLRSFRYASTINERSQI